MRYFEMNADHFEKWVNFPDDDNRFLVELDATTSCESIPEQPLSITWNDEDDDNGKKWLDIHEHSPVYSVMSRKAVACLQGFLNSSGFIVPTKGLENNYVIYNVTNVVKDAFNWNKSDIIGNKTNLSLINRAALYKEKLDNQHIFKLAESRVDIFVSEDFKNKAEKCGLAGLIFEEVILT